MAEVLSLRCSTLLGCVHQTLLTIADEDGNYLQEAWEHILTCVSRFEHLHLLGEGAPSDATFFAQPASEPVDATLSKSASIRKKV